MKAVPVNTATGRKSPLNVVTSMRALVAVKTYRAFHLSCFACIVAGKLVSMEMLMIFVLQKLAPSEKKPGILERPKKNIYDENIEKLKNGSAKILKVASRMFRAVFSLSIGRLLTVV